MITEVVPCEICGATVAFDAYAAHLRTLHERVLLVGNELSAPPREIWPAERRRGCIINARDCHALMRGKCGILLRM